jgi:hypothetical protein
MADVSLDVIWPSLDASIKKAVTNHGWWHWRHLIGLETKWKKKKEWKKWQFHAKTDETWKPFWTRFYTLPVNQAPINDYVDSFSATRTTTDRRTLSLDENGTRRWDVSGTERARTGSNTSQIGWRGGAGSWIMSHQSSSSRDSQVNKNNLLEYDFNDCFFFFWWGDKMIYFESQSSPGIKLI